jgi:hypothetical protein
MRKLYPLCFISFGILACINNTSAQLSTTSTSNLYSESSSMNCATFLPPGNSDNQTNLIQNWSAFVSKQAFSLPFDGTENYLRNLRACFSNDGWNEFSRALNQSGNITLIQAKQYNTSAQVIGLIAISHQANTNTWETKTPIQIIYKNDTSKISQELDIHLKIVKERNNQLTVSQIIGIPKEN